MTEMAPEYAFSVAPDKDIQLAALEEMLDPVTTQLISRLPIAPAMRCWEVGAGGGSIAHALARIVGPDGMVLATDLDISQLAAAPNVQARQHDVRSDPAPEVGPFDFIHARLLLMHLPERVEVLGRLVEALAPGGWILVEDFDLTAAPQVLAAPDEADKEIYERVTDTVVRFLESSGTDPTWAGQAYGAMAALGLTDLHCAAHTDSWTGGGVGSRLYQSTTHQLRDTLLDSGVSLGEQERYTTLTRDQRFAAWWFRLVSTWGRRVLG